MQDVTEQSGLAKEISDAISKPVEFGEEFDEVGDTLLFLFFFICSIFPMLMCHSSLTNDFLYFFWVSLFCLWSNDHLDSLLLLCRGGNRKPLPAYFNSKLLILLHNPFIYLHVASRYLMWHFVKFVRFTSRCITSLCYCLFHFSQLAPDIKMSLVKTIPNTDHLLRETIYCLLRKQHNFIYLFFIRLKPCVFLIRMSCWLSWMSYSRRRWREAFWRLEGQRMSTSPTCLQLRYPPEPVRI